MSRYRKMTTRLTLWGTQGRIFADRQECQVFLRDDAELPRCYRSGWNVKYTTELTEPVGFYLRGEEYSAELDHFVRRVAAEKTEGENDFGSAVVTDRCIEIMMNDAAGGRTVDFGGPAHLTGALPVGTGRVGLPRPRPAGPVRRLLRRLVG